MIGKTVTLKKEKNAQSKDTMTHPVKNFFENMYAVPYKLLCVLTRGPYVALKRDNKKRNGDILTSRAK
jgi:hypothetical protein